MNAYLQASRKKLTLRRQLFAPPWVVISLVTTGTCPEHSLWKRQNRLPSKLLRGQRRRRPPTSLMRRSGSDFQGSVPSCSSVFTTNQADPATAIGSGKDFRDCPKVQANPAHLASQGNLVPGDGTTHGVQEAASAGSHEWRRCRFQAEEEIVDAQPSSVLDENELVADAYEHCLPSGSTLQR